MAEMITIVDENDNEIGFEDKEKCHDGDGILHRAFLALVINDKKEILLARRSDKKRLWPGYWDGTVASHVKAGEGYEEAAIRRLPDELGVRCDDVKYVTKFFYHIPYKDAGSEREICAVITARCNEVKPAPEEISEWKFMRTDELKQDIEKNRDAYTPWFLIAINKLDETGEAIFK